jgi:hypothetical protein
MFLAPATEPLRRLHGYIAFRGVPETRPNFRECNVKCVTIHCIRFRIGSPPMEKI